MADLKDKHPLPPQPRKKYLAHSLYGLGNDHKGVVVQQLNQELRAQHHMKRNHFRPGTSSELTQVVVSNGVGWGDGGKVVTQNVVGKFKYQSLVMANACERIQRIWRIKVHLPI